MKRSLESFLYLSFMALFGIRFFKVTLSFFSLLFKFVVVSVKNKNLLNTVVHGAVQLLPPKMLCDTLCLTLSLEEKIIQNVVRMEEGR